MDRVSTAIHFGVAGKDDAPAMTEEVLILVDTDDNSIGVGKKMQVHREGWLHRAFSIFVFDARGRLLLQQRAAGKYHSAGLWSNTCCGHPRANEDCATAAHRRLREEMGFDCALEATSSLIYKAHLPNGLIEHEYDHIFIGRYDGEMCPAPSEVADWRWIDIAAMSDELAATPEQYTVWFRQIVEQAGVVGLAGWSERSRPRHALAGAFTQVRDEAVLTAQFLKHNALTNIVAPFSMSLVALFHYDVAWSRALASLAWCALTLYCVDVPNQIRGYREDRLNKPSRPIPAGRVSIAGAWRRWVVALALYFLVAWVFGVLLVTLAWQALMLIYVFTPLLHRSWFTKNIIFLALAFFLMHVGAWMVVSGGDIPRDIVQWIVIESLVCSVIYLAQDFRDVDGDIEMKRRTLPIALGQSLSRWYVSALVLFASMFGSYLLTPHLTTYPTLRLAWVAAGLSLCGVIGLRLILFRSRRADQHTYMLVESYLVFLSMSSALSVSIR